jgi:hypothetical protein
VQGCGAGAALVQRQPGLVAVNRAISSDNARVSALLRRLSASRFSGRIRSLVRAVFTVSATATAWAPRRLLGWLEGVDSAAYAGGVVPAAETFEHSGHGRQYPP